MRDWVLPFAAGAAAVGLVATSVVAVTQWQRAGAAEEQVAELGREVSELRAEVRRLEEELEAARAADPLQDLLRGLLGGDLGDLADLFGTDPGALAELLEDLLSEDTGVLDDLLDGFLGGAFGGAGGIPGMGCMVPDGGGGLDGLLDGLLGQPSVPDGPDELVAVIADQVAELRELDWQEEVEVDFLDADAVRGRLEELLDEAADPVAEDAEQRLLVALGAIPAGTDLAGLRHDLLDEQVAGFYVPDTAELVVRVPDDGDVRPMDRVTLAHELEHALADQELGLPDLDDFDDDADGALAALSVVEGDATLLMNLWALAHLSFADQLGMVTTGDLAAAQASLEAAPHFVQRELVFPYTEGLDFVCDRYLEGGWAAVDDAYGAVPATSAEVMFDAAGTPAVTATLTAPAGYQELRTTTFGAAHLMWLFEAPGGDPDRALDDPRGRATAWDGGEARVWAAGDVTAVGLALVDGGRGTSLCGSVRAWYAAAFPDAVRTGRNGATVYRDLDDSAAVRCDGDDVLVATAPDLATAVRIVGG